MTNDVIVEKVINIDQNSRSQTAIESVWSVSKLSTESVGSRRELVANSVVSTHRRRRRDTTRQLSRVVVGGVYWVGLTLLTNALCAMCIQAAVWKPLPSLVFGLLSAISGLLYAFLPETLGQVLPDTIEQAERFQEDSNEKRNDR